jgi:hypothetical protein
MNRLILIFFLLLGCKEFYDEEFEEFEERRSQTVTGSSRFIADLTSTDGALTSLSGDATIEVKDEAISVEVVLKGIPSNISKVTYGIISEPCSSLSLSIPNSNQGDRSVEIKEGLDRAAFLNDLQSSGTVQNDLVLIGKSFIIRGTPQFSGLPNGAGTNELTLACGELNDASENRNESADVFTPREVGDSL